MRTGAMSKKTIPHSIGSFELFICNILTVCDEPRKTAGDPAQPIMVCIELNNQSVVLP